MLSGDLQLIKKKNSVPGMFTSNPVSFVSYSIYLHGTLY